MRHSFIRYLPKINIKVFHNQVSWIMVQLFSFEIRDQSAQYIIICVKFKLLQLWTIFIIYVSFFETRHPSKYILREISLPALSNFIHSEKVTKIWFSILIWRYVEYSKKVGLFRLFLAFSEYINFNIVNASMVVNYYLLKCKFLM